MSKILVNHRTKQVETLIGVLEVLDPKLKALGVEANGEMTYIADCEGVCNIAPATIK